MLNPGPNITIVTTVDMVNGVIRQRMDYPGGLDAVELQVVDTKEAQFREALIALGWTPPNEGV